MPPPHVGCLWVQDFASMWTWPVSGTECYIAALDSSATRGVLGRWLGVSACCYKASNSWVRVLRMRTSACAPRSLDYRQLQPCWLDYTFYNIWNILCYLFDNSLL